MVAIHEWLPLKNPASPEKFLANANKISPPRAKAALGEDYEGFGV
jgi:hypothetical protein